jgi:hypothetical protein
VLGILALEGLAAVAIVAYFRRNRHGHSLWRALVAPAASAVGLFTFVALSVSQIDLLTGASTTVNTLLLAPLPLALIIGVALATCLRRAKPAVYASLNTVAVE